MKLRFAWLAFALAALSAPIYAQPTSCQVSATGLTVRVEGKNELVSDVLVTCTGGNPTPVGQLIPTFDFTLTFNANVTSRRLGSNGGSEALLLLDDPAPGAQFPCTTAACPSQGNGSGFGYYGPAPNLVPNVYQGFYPTSISSSPPTNVLLWKAIPADSPGNKVRTFRFTNLRLDPNTAPDTDLSVQVSTNSPVPITPAKLTVATVSRGLVATVRDATSANPAPSGVTVNLASAGSATATRAATIRFATQFFQAERSRTVAAFSGPDTAPGPVPQNTPGTAYNSESGFYNPQFPPGPDGNLGLAGLADWGTRFVAKFTNIPAGVNVFVALRNDTIVASSGPAARLIATDAAGAGPFTAIAGNGTIAQLTPVGGTAIAVWEVLRNNDSTSDLFDFGVFLTYSAGIAAAPSAIGVSQSFAPTAGGIPTFVATPSNTQTAVNFTVPVAPPPPPPPPPPTPSFSVSPGSLTFTGAVGGTIRAQTLSVVSSPSSIGFNVSSNGTIPLVFSPPGSSTPATISVSVNTRGLAAGTYNDLISIGGVGGVPVTVPATLIVTAGPVITSLNPNNTLAGSPAFTLTVNGSNFTPTTVVNWNGAPLPTVFVNGGQLTAAIPAALVALSGAAEVTAVTADGVVSNTVPFTINQFRLITIDPTIVAAGGPAFVLTATGVGFQTGARVSVGGLILTPDSASATSLTVTVPASAIAQPGTLRVAVVNPNSTSNALDLIVTAPFSLTRIAPDTVTAGGPAFTLNLTGIGFAPTASVQIGGTTLTPGSGGSATSLSVNVPASVIATAGTLQVRVINPGPISSNSLTLTVNPAPRITALDPSSATAGAPAFTLTVTGSNLTGGTVRWNGNSLATTGVSAGQLRAQVPAALVAFVTTANVDVTVAGVVSNTLLFAVVLPPTLTSLNPSSVNIGSAAFTLTIGGTGFQQGMTALWNGQPLATVFVSTTQLTAQVPASLLTSAATVNITASTSDGVVTNSLPFRVVLPPPPNVTITTPGNAGSGQNQNVTLTLGGTYPADLVGTLTLTFTGDSGLPDDPSIQFTNGRRTITFNVPAGTTPQIPPATFQTGTTAGTITISLTFTGPGNAPVTPDAPPQRVTVGRAAPTLSTVTCSRNSGGFTVVIDGYTNTREATTATFDFTAASGASLGTTTLTVQAGPLFSGWFGSTGASTAGGLFRYTQPFTVNGTATVATIAVRLGNTVGNSATGTCQLP